MFRSAAPVGSSIRLTMAAVEGIKAVAATTAALTFTGPAGLAGVIGSETNCQPFRN